MPVLTSGFGQIKTHKAKKRKHVENVPKKNDQEVSKRQLIPNLEKASRPPSDAPVELKVGVTARIITMSKLAALHSLCGSHSPTCQSTSVF